MTYDSSRCRSKSLGAPALWMALCALSFPVFLSAQTVYPNSMPQRGLTAGPYYTFDKLETINTANGNVVYTVPLAQLPPGRAGFSQALSLIYNSQIYDLSTSFQATKSSFGNTIEVSQLTGSIYGGWRYGYQYALDLERKPGSATVSCTNPPPGQKDQFKLRLITPDGGPHELSIYGVARDLNGNGYYPYDPTGTGFCGQSLNQDMTYYTTDGTHIRVVVSQQGPTSGQDAWMQHQWTAYFPDGSTVTGMGGQTTSLADRNGNTITVATYANSNGSPSNVLTDAFGRTITIQHNGQQDTVMQTGFGGQTVTATVTWGGVAIDPTLQ